MLSMLRTDHSTCKIFDAAASQALRDCTAMGIFISLIAREQICLQRAQNHHGGWCVVVVVGAVVGAEILRRGEID